MKTKLLISVVSITLRIVPVLCSAEEPPATQPDSTAQSQVAPPSTSPAPATDAPSTSKESVEAAPKPGSEALVMNFRGAPLNLVLDYLSDAAGFIINKQTD